MAATVQSFPAPMTMSQSISRAEIQAYAVLARLGDILPICFRLGSMRVDSAWSDRSATCLVVGPECQADALETACALMPRASEPRLLRAAAAIARAETVALFERDACLAAARQDLADAARFDPADVTVRLLLAEVSRLAR